jgi:hypothetical protein
MAQGRCGNEQIKIADQFSGAAQGAAELPETPAYFLIDAQDDHAGKKLGKHRFTPGGVLGKVHTLPQFRDGDDTQSQSLRAKYLQAAGYGLDSIEVVNNPIGVHQEGSQRHRRGSGRVVTRRLSLTSRFSLSASINPAQPPAVRVRKSASILKGKLKIVTVTSWPSVSSSFSSGSRIPPEYRALIVVPTCFTSASTALFPNTILAFRLLLAA